MPTITSENDITARALARYGYTDREAGFLALAGLHSGYFLRRQYQQFLGKLAGGTCATLIEKLIANAHVRVCTYVGQAHLYHLCSRRLYAALGQGDNRNRRDRQPFTMKAKLMALDFVLTHPRHRYLVTEAEKVAYFTGTLKVNHSALPTKLYRAATGDHACMRHFVDKYPIYIAPAPQGDDSEATFSYIDAGATSVCGFETYLDHYRSLFRELPLFRVVYIADQASLFGQAERLFHRFVNTGGEATEAADGGTPAHLRSYFETRFLFETGDFASFDRAKLIQLRDQRQRFSTPAIEARYVKWCADREHAAKAPSARETASSTPLRGAFSVCLLEHNYDVFGNITAF
jgi:hypothetical protein